MIINSLLDTDLYKLTMMQSVLHNAPDANVEYRFVNRDVDVDLGSYVDRIEDEVKQLCELKFTEDELDYLSGLRFFKPEFLEFLRLFQLNTKFINISEIDGRLDITIKGPWLHTIMFEVPILAIVSEVYCTTECPLETFDEGVRRLEEKVELVSKAKVAEDFTFSDFGTRRRYSHQWHRKIVSHLKSALPTAFIGTSNVLFAKEFDLKPIGTMAHEYFQAFQALGGRLVDSQKAALQSWANEYRGDLGIALSDTYGIDAFLRDFDLYFCKLFDGVRHDSGDPFAWGDKVLNHYHKMRIDPKTKQLVFSDSLTIPKVIELYRYFHARTQLGFGLGTNLTNDLDCARLNIVIKMIYCNGAPVAKVSDEKGKRICDDPSFFAYLLHVFELDKEQV